MTGAVDFRSLVPRRVVIGVGAVDRFLAAFRPAFPDVEFRAAPHTAVTEADLAWADTYIGFKRPPLPTMGRVRWVHCSGAGIDSWMYPVELPRDILLTRTSESFGPMIAEWALSRALAFAQGLRDVEARQARHEWADLPVRFIRGTKVVVVGTGDVGSHIASAFVALGADAVGVSRTGRGDRSIFRAVHTMEALPSLVGDADWLVLALPLTTATRGMIDERILSACRGAVLLNAGRGAVVVESLLPKALDAGWLSGAALDVFEIEPLPADSPLWADRRVMVSPHISGPTTVDATVVGFRECVEALRRGERPSWTVDRDREY